MVTTATFAGGITPTSSPNALALLAPGNNTQQFATWGTSDTNNGDVTVQANFNSTGITANLTYGLFIRSNANPFVLSSSTAYWYQLSPNGLVSRISKIVAGVNTALSSVTLSAWSEPGWFQLTFTATGTSLTVSVQRLSDSFWLNSSGSFQVGQTNVHNITDSAVTGAGFSGLSIQSRSDDTYSDDWLFETAAPISLSPYIRTIRRDIVPWLIRQTERVKFISGIPAGPTLLSPLHGLETNSPRKFFRGWVHSPHTATKTSTANTPGTVIRGPSVRSPRRLTAGSAKVQTGHGTPPTTFTPPWKPVKSPRKLAQGWGHSPHTAHGNTANPPTFATPLRGLQTRSPRKLPPGSSSVRPTTRSDSSILPKRGISARSPRRMNVGRADLQSNLNPQQVIGAGPVLHFVRVTSPRRLAPGWVHSPHTAKGNPPPPPTFNTPLRGPTTRGARRFFAGQAAILKGSKPTTPGTVLRGLQTVGKRPPQPGRAKSGRATTLFLNTPLRGLQTIGQRPWHAGKAVVARVHDRARVSGFSGRSLMVRSPRRLNPGNAITPKSLPRIQPYTTIRGVTVSGAHSWRPGKIRQGTPRAPFSTPATPLRWQPIDSPRLLRRGWAHVPHTSGNSIVTTPSVRLPLSGIRACSPRRLRPGSTWSAALTPHALGGPPLRTMRTSSPRRLTAGKAKPSGSLLPNTVTTVRSWKAVSRTAMIRRGWSILRPTMGVAPIIARFAGLSRPASLPIPPRLRRGRSLIVPGTRPDPIAPPGQVTIREAVAARLNALSALTAIVGPRIYWDQLSQKAVFPALFCTVDSRDWGHNLPGADGTSTAQFTITAISGNESTSVAIAKAVRKSFDGFQGFQSGVQFMRTFITDESDDSAQSPDGSGSWIYMVHTEYEIVHRVPYPTQVTQTDV